MSTFVVVWSAIGAFTFGVVIGWVTYRTLRRNSASASISDLASVIGAVGGAAVTGLFPRETGAFGAYCIGLAIGFFGYLASALVLARSTGPTAKVSEWLGNGPQPAPSTSPGLPKRAGP